MANDVAALKSELKKARDYAVDLETKQVELEKIIDLKNQEITTLKTTLAESTDKLGTLEQRIQNIQTEEAKQFAIEPATLALLTLHAIRDTSDVNGIPIAVDRQEDYVKLFAERRIPMAIKLVREVLDQLVKSKFAE